ncbi:Ger(x)C family spore germination protein [Rummeliibacillus stabekisii]|uniref:Ger(x)C family spore germination protein n=1 Tax=Rummeliibacillus stabekisii TaxID=241244 RepID=UPI00203A4D9A|nr:Ger(x)C family spore germination protein [Rummeliibacillus stabekisii]MCM3316742.1 Ger(x)C family spore germination protein [Rummeliibacillus stabekisii]
MNKKILILLIMFIPLISGCWDSKEAERVFYIYGIGLDYKDGKYQIYTQIISFANIAKSDQPSNPETIQVEVGHASGKTDHEAFYNLYKSMDEELYWGHLSYIIFSEDLLKSGEMNSFINSFMRFYNTRYQTWVYSTKEPMNDVLLVEPILNKAISLSKLSDPLNSFKQDSTIEPLKVRELILKLDEPGYEANIPSVSILENWETKKEKNAVTNINGVSVVSPKEFKGNISGDKAKGLSWMNKETKRAELTIMLKDSESGAKRYITANGKVASLKVEPIVKRNSVFFDVKVKLEVELRGFQNNIEEKEVRKEVEKEVKKEIKDTFTAGLNINSDVFRLSEYLYRKDVNAWKKFESNGKIELNENSIHNINVEIVSVYSGRKNFSETIRR